MEQCKSCVQALKQIKKFASLRLEASFTKIGNKLHLGFDRPEICAELVDFVPDTILLAGNGSVDGDCWSVLENAMKEAGLLGSTGTFNEGILALTYLASMNGFFCRTNIKEDDNPMLSLKEKVVKSLNGHQTNPRKLYCTCCNRHIELVDSKSILILTTNWDLGLFSHFQNVIQLHGRCDHPKIAVLPQENISSLMARNFQDLERLGTRFLPGPFLEKCLKKVNKAIFWGTKLNDYDAPLWHFIHSFYGGGGKQKKDLQIGIAAKDSGGFQDLMVQVGRYFPRIPINNCICSLLNKESSEK